MKNLLSDIAHRLEKVYPQGEAHAVARTLLECGFGVSMVDCYADKVRDFSEEELALLDEKVKRLESGEPVQYVLDLAEFGGLTFELNNAVLIPRPETLELVEWITAETNPKARILDIGTGSGCIAVSLAKRLPEAKVSALDVSKSALDVAQKNAQRNAVEIKFFQTDILATALSEEKNKKDISEKYDVIVSNPPYICNSEKAEMADNVLKFEPHDALFVNDDKPLIFYEAIADFSLQHLENGGALFVEINRRFGHDICNLFKEKGFTDIQLRKDSNGNDRKVKAVKK